MSSPEPSTACWLEACDADALADDAILPVSLGEAELLLIRTGDHLVACERACPHEQADLLHGHVTGGRLHCPHHAASFDLTDGTVSSGWSCRPLRLHRASVRDGKVMVEASALDALTVGSRTR